jgi:4-hydroxybutyrate CoA-transferase
VTEYGVVNLLGKSQRERAALLISVAHPDFRPDLQQAARQLFWP